MKKLTKWFGGFFIIFFQVVLSDGPNTETMKGIEETLRNPIVSNSKVVKTEIANIDKQEQEVPHKTLLERKKRATSNDSLQFQYEQHCKGYKPCTCYYPDHANVTSFELSTDETTINASRVNDTGPGNCEDLQSLGYSLEGFHLVRLNSIRVKAIYCSFKQNNVTKTITNPTKAAKIRRALKSNDTAKRKCLKFCGGFGNKSCTFYYPDYPDAKTTSFNQISNNASIEDKSKETPKSCEDLKQNGYSLTGFYLVRLNSMKLKAMYCNFKKLSSENKLSKTDDTLKNDATMSLSKVSKFCNGFGSQPCSCFYPNVRDVPQFELSSDDITRSALKANGAGPTSCKDLEKLGHRLNGFYMVRFKERVIKIIFCNLKIYETQVMQKGGKTTTKKKTKHLNRINDFFPLVRTSSSATIIDDEEEETTETVIITKQPTVHTFSYPTITTVIQPTPVILNSQENSNEPSGIFQALGVEAEKLFRDPARYFESLFRIPRNVFEYGRLGHLLKNEHGKCLAVFTNGALNPKENGVKLLQSHCNSQEKGQRWRVVGDHLCNGWNKCLTLPNNSDQESLTLDVIIHTDFDTDSWLQKWNFENPGLIFNYHGSCLGVSDSDSDGGEVKIEKCNTSNKGQWWYFDF